MIDEAVAAELGTMIVRTPGILGGKPRIRGHRVGVHRVAGWCRLAGSARGSGTVRSALIDGFSVQLDDLFAGITRGV